MPVPVVYSYSLLSNRRHGRELAHDHEMWGPTGRVNAIIGPDFGGMWGDGVVVGIWGNGAVYVQDLT